MNEKQLEKLIKSEIENSAPDKDILWEKIENKLTPKEGTASEIRITPKKSYVKIILAAAACAAVALALPRLLSLGSLETSEHSPQFSEDNASDSISEDIADSNEEAAGDSEEDYSAEAPNTQESGTGKLLSYDALSFPSYSETVLECLGAPYGDSYFVEDNVLSEAEYIVDGTVKRAFSGKNGRSICYEIEVAASYPDTGMDTVIVESCSPYKMKRGRQYLIPVNETENSYRTAFDNVPQIEFTSDGGMVYYNGWSTLQGESIIYPQKTVDDFFYDRMMFSYTGDYSELISKFYETKNL